MTVSLAASITAIVVMAAAASAAPGPSIESEAATSIRSTDATLEATIDSEGLERRNRRLRPTTRSPTLVAFTEEQSGVVFHYTSLVVSKRGQATVRYESCVRRFHLGAALWKRLKAALRQTDLHAVAGNHVPATPHAEESTWVIVVGHDTVRITASSIPPELRARLEPLLKTVEEVVSVGKRRMPRSCASKRTVSGTG